MPMDKAEKSRFVVIFVTLSFIALAALLAFLLDFRAELAKGSANGDVAPSDLNMDELTLDDIDFGIVERLLEAEEAAVGSGYDT